MLGRDYSLVGAQHTVVGRLGDWSLWRGRVRVRWLNRSSLFVLDNQNTLFVVSLRGNVEVRLKNALAEKDENDAGLSKRDEEDFSYWFEDPRSLLISRKDKEDYAMEQRRLVAISKAEYVEPMKAIRANLRAVDFARLMNDDVLEILVADVSTQMIKVLERDSWNIIRSIGGLGNALGSHYGISGIDTFRIDEDTTLICTLDSELNRVQIFEASGNPLATFGEEGPKYGQFRRPCAISALVKTPSWHHGEGPIPKNSALRDPDWFRGNCEKDVLEAYLMDSGLDISAGDFAMGRRVDNPRIYDLVYMNKSFRTAHIVIRRVPQNEGGRGVFIQTKDGRGQVTYPSIWHLILDQKQLSKPVSESRPYALIAVADPENFRVQILRYFWTESEFFSPSLDYLLTVGGLRGHFYPLRDPVDVSYSPTGELAIADTDRVIILTPYMTLAKEVALPYNPFILTREQREQKAKQEAENSGLGKSMVLGDTVDTKKSISSSSSSSSTEPSIYINRNPSWPSWINTIQEGRDQSSAYVPQDSDKKVVSVSFASDGKLAVGYRSGGVLVFSPYKSLPCGVFRVLTLASFERVLSFCSFQDLESIRGCSRLFHNYTRDLRFSWRLGKMRCAYHDVMVYAFLRWSTNNAGEFALNKDIYQDAHGNPLCRHWLETASCPLRNSCPFSHKGLQFLGFREFYPSATEIGLELRQFLLCAYITFTPKFVWQKERFLEELFKEYAFNVERLRRGDHFAGNKMIRSVHAEIIKVLSFKDYSNIMALLEEDFVGSKPIEMHPLFHQYKQGSLQVIGPYDFKSLEKRIYVDPLEQFSRGLGISCVPLKTKKVNFMKGMEDQGRGKDTDNVRTHIETFEHMGQKTASLLRNIFPATAKK